ncbi:hypothetical protein K466DRAFT_599167 [Polyporus arcularius HHB13444]|uniref:Uncharacterized protein n=1 Tax=Polyporus arcularius HHB13444 TaxID=1314778 RepID=A0A5C3PDL6_9APHY|nr:hypothetical protein K466DRAFT_599167 [Polyporus arcularius HHB13444]
MSQADTATHAPDQVPDNTRTARKHPRQDTSVARDGPAQALATTPNSIKSWNASIRAQVKERTMSYAVQGFLYPVYGGKPRLIMVPIKSDCEYEEDSPRWIEDLDFERWFPFGHIQTTVSSVPQLDRVLPNGFSLITTKNQLRTLRNACAESVLSVSHKGNLIVLRHSSRNPACLTNLYSTDRTLVDLLLIAHFKSLQDRESEDEI